MANVDRLTSSYFKKQIERNLSVVDKIRARSALATGRVIPSSGDLPIHAGRRIEATVMFLDICKFSTRPSWTETEQENLLQILSLFFTEMIRIVEDYGGTVEKNTGDGLMAYFTKQAGDDASPQQRAIAAAITMFAAAQNIINPLIINSNLEPIDFRVCVDHGPITVAQVGVARGFNGIVAIGATANIACKMLAFAEPNTILLGSKGVIGLPLAWQAKFTVLKTTDTGWVHTDTGMPYAFWQYNGRWILPTR